MGSDLDVIRAIQSVEERYPEGGADFGWNGEYNRGWNACRVEVLKSVLAALNFKEAGRG